MFFSSQKLFPLLQSLRFYSSSSFFVCVFHRLFSYSSFFFFALQDASLSFSHYGLLIQPFVRVKSHLLHSKHVPHPSNDCKTYQTTGCKTIVKTRSTRLDHFIRLFSSSFSFIPFYFRVFFLFFAWAALIYKLDYFMIVARQNVALLIIVTMICPDDTNENDERTTTKNVDNNDPKKTFMGTKKKKKCTVYTAIFSTQSDSTL